MNKEDELFIREENLRDFIDNFALPNRQNEGWATDRHHFEILLFSNSKLLILYKNQKPIGQHILTYFKDTISSHNLIIVPEERGKGYGGLLIQDLAKLSLNSRILGISVPEMTNVYVKHANYKKYNKAFVTRTLFTEIYTDSLENNGALQLTFSEENLNLFSGVLTEALKHERAKVAEYYLKNGFVFVYQDKEKDCKITGFLSALNDGKVYSINTFVAENLEAAKQLTSAFLKFIKDAEFTLVLHLVENSNYEKFSSFFSIKINPEKYFTILDSDSNSSYENFYGIALALI